jgi:hypothetical protein
MKKCLPIQAVAGHGSYRHRQSPRSAPLARAARQETELATPPAIYEPSVVYVNARPAQPRGGLMARAISLYQQWAEAE